MADWQIDLQDAFGSAIASDLEFKDARISWVLDGPGSADVTLIEDDALTNWLSGRRRVLFKRDGALKFTGYLNNVSASYTDANTRSLTCGVLGLASILDFRVVHGDFNQVSTVATTIATSLITHTDTQEDTGITTGTITGTAPSFTRRYCDGDVIGDEIRELATAGNFDWEVDHNKAFNAWVGGRGTDLSGTYTLARNKTISLDITAETSDVVTHVTVLGADPDGPCGPPVEVRTAALSGYPRREVVTGADRNDVVQMQQMGDAELEARQRARLNAQASIHITDLPWAFGAVWLGDVIFVETPTPLGGTQKMRITDVEVSLERGGTEWHTYNFELI